jgi:urea transport system substrate-binding protein
LATVCSAWHKSIWLYLTIFLFTATPLFASDTIKIGVLNSFSGTMQESETPVANAVELAVEEINSGGGLLGKKIQIITADGKSDPTVFAKEAEKLIVQNNVQAIFGCWTSASRKSVKPIVEKYDNLLSDLTQ